MIFQALGGDSMAWSLLGAAARRAFSLFSREAPRVCRIERASGEETQAMATVPWMSDYSAALEQAKSERKFVFLDVFNPG